MDQFRESAQLDDAAQVKMIEEAIDLHRKIRKKIGELFAEREKASEDRKGDIDDEIKMCEGCLDRLGNLGGTPFGNRSPAERLKEMEASNLAALPDHIRDAKFHLRMLPIEDLVPGFNKIPPRRGDEKV